MKIGIGLLGVMAGLMSGVGFGALPGGVPVVPSRNAPPPYRNRARLPVAPAFQRKRVGNEGVKLAGGRWGPNQRQIRKDRRQAAANGFKNAFK